MTAYQLDSNLKVLAYCNKAAISLTGSWIIDAGANDPNLQARLIQFLVDQEMRRATTLEAPTLRLGLPNTNHTTECEHDGV